MPRAASVPFLVFVAAHAGTWIALVLAGRRRGTPAPADSIVVFGAEVVDGRPSRELQARLDHTATLFRAGVAPTIVCSGGHPGPGSEPRVMRAALVEAGIPAGAIEIDESGGSTGATVAAFRGSVVAVSSPYHALRILYEARRLGMTCAFSPAPSPVMGRLSARVRQDVYEVVAFWWYVVTPWRRPRRPAADKQPTTG